MIDQTPRQLRDSEDEWMTVEEVAAHLKVTPAWVRAHSNGNREPTIPSAKFGKLRRFRREAVMEFGRRMEQMTAGDVA